MVAADDVVVASGDDDPRPERYPHRRPDVGSRRIVVEVVRVDVVVLEHARVLGEAGVPAGEERVRGDPRGVVPDVVVVEMGRVAHSARVRQVVVVEVAVPDLLVQAAPRVELRVARVRRVRRGVVHRVGRAARVDGRVAVAGALAVLGEPVVGGKHQTAVLARVEELHVVHEVAVRLHDVNVVLLRMPPRDVLEYEPVRAVDRQGDVLLRAGATRPAVASRRLAGVDHNVLRTRPRPLDLKVAADARPEVDLRDPVAVQLRRRRRAGAKRASQHLDQVLVVRAAELVAVGEPDGAATPEVGVGQVLLALRVVRRLGARRRLRVDARHDHDAVVVVGGVDRFLDRMEPAALGQLPVDARQPARGAEAQLPPRLRGP